jgi:hypothetical protein
MVCCIPPPVNHGSTAHVLAILILPGGFDLWPALANFIDTLIHQDIHRHPSPSRAATRTRA